MCHGTVIGWKYRAYQAGSVYLDIYKPEEDGTFTLNSKSKVQATSAGEFVHFLNVDEYIGAHPGYSVGFHYESSSSAAILSEVWNNEPMHNMPYSEAQMSHIIYGDVHDAQLPEGGKQGPLADTSVTALPTFIPIIQCKSACKMRQTSTICMCE